MSEYPLAQSLSGVIAKASLYLAIGLLFLAPPAARAQDGPTQSVRAARFLEDARASLDPADRTDPLRTVRALRRFAYRRLLFSGLGIGKINTDLANKATDLDDALSMLDESHEGLWCMGTSTILSFLYRELGFETSLVSWGENSTLAHAQVLVKVGSKWYMQDAYFNYDYVTDDGQPLPYPEALKRFASGRPPMVRQDIDERTGLFASVNNAAEYVPADRQKDIRCTGAPGSMRCNVTMTLSRFAQSWSRRLATEDALVRNQLSEDRLDNMSVFVRWASKTELGKTHADMDQQMASDMRAITGCAADDGHVWCSDARSAPANPNPLGESRLLDVAWTSLVKSRLAMGPAPITLETPAKAYDYGAASAVLVARQAETVTVTLRDMRGKLGISLMTPDGAQLLSKEQAAAPSQTDQSFPFPVTPQLGDYIIVVRNYDDPGVAGAFEITSVIRKPNAPRTGPTPRSVQAASN